MKIKTFEEFITEQTHSIIPFDELEQAINNRYEYTNSPEDPLDICEMDNDIFKIQLYLTSQPYNDIYLVCKSNKWYLEYEDDTFEDVPFLNKFGQKYNLENNYTTSLEGTVYSINIPMTIDTVLEFIDDYIDMCENNNSSDTDDFNNCCDIRLKK